jgi:hypothetical protein
VQSLPPERLCALIMPEVEVTTLEHG